jgi:hypothetical protein
LFSKFYRVEKNIIKCCFHHPEVVPQFIPGKNYEAFFNNLKIKKVNLTQEERHMKTKGLKKVKFKYKGYTFEHFVDPNMRDYSNDPFVIAHTAKVAAFIKRVGLPKNLGHSK